MSDIILNKNLVESCNNRNMYNRGNHIQESANAYYKSFIKEFNSTLYNNKQKDIYEKRLSVFKDFLTTSFNEYLNIAQKYVSVNVAGPANYNHHKFNKISNSMDNKLQDIDNKVKKFFKNTEVMLKNSYSKEEILEKYKNGYDEPISSDDPIAKEKLKAKLEFLENRHNKYKDFNKNARKNNEKQLPSYMLSNSNQNIKSVKERINTLEKMEQLNNRDYNFENGKVVFDKEDNRIKILFDDIPSVEVRENLKSHAYRWSPTNQAWQRKITPDAIYTTKRLFPKIEKSIVEDTKSLTM